MENRIIAKFQELRSVKRKAFIAYLTLGYPDLETTVRLVPALEKAGADIIELGIPFSDPMADGPTIQAASSQALKNNLTLAKMWKTVKRIRRVSSIPLAFMTYYNPIHFCGARRFIEQSRQAGVDGLIVPDLPLEEADSFRALADKSQLATVFFVSPTTPTSRIGRLADASTGFVYYISLAGVTGARKRLPGDLSRRIKTVKSHSRRPVCVGFGISTPQQVRQIARVADGVIVGSAIIKEIARHQSRKDMLTRVARFVKHLTRGL